MKKEIALERIEGEEKIKIIKAAQKLVNSHYDIKKIEIMGKKTKFTLEGFDTFKKLLEKQVVLGEISDEEIYEIARKLVITTIKKGLNRH